MSTPMAWTFADLPSHELRQWAAQACECVTSERSGTRHGYSCPAHRAQRELERREANLLHYHTLHD